MDIKMCLIFILRGFLIGKAWQQIDSKRSGLADNMSPGRSGQWLSFLNHAKSLQITDI